MALRVRSALGFIRTAHRPRARAFHTGVMGFALKGEDAFGATLDMAGLTVRLTDTEGHRAGPHGVMGWTVPDIDAAVAALAGKRVVFTVYPGISHDAARPPRRGHRRARPLAGGHAGRAGADQLGAGQPVCRQR